MFRFRVGALALASAFSVSSVQAHDSIYADDVVVTSSRIPQARENVVADVSVIEREEIEQAGLSTLVELLRTQPGVEIESNGSFGATSAIHLRGTGSQAVVVLIDGMRMGSATTGTTALEQLSPEQIERIEIVRGPASSLYGSEAVGGVIQIFTRRGDDKPHADAYLGYGSYNTRRAAASLGGTAGDTRYALNASALYTDGFSSLNTNSGRDADDDAYRNLTLSGNISHTLAQGHDLGLQFFRSEGHGEFDGRNFPAHQDMRQHNFALTSNNRFLNNWLSRLKLGEGMDDLHSVGSFGTSNIRTYQRQYSWQNDLNLPLGTLTLAYDRLEEHVVSGTAYSQTRRDNNGWLASYVVEQGAHAFHAGIRRDDNSQFGQHNTGNIGYGYKLDQFWRVTGSFGTAYRAPTFNDLYWPLQNFGGGFSYGGNPDLKPETSRNREVSVIYDQGHHRVSATAFHNEINNLIVSSQGLPADYPANVGAATIRGLTLAYEGWFGTYHLRANADFQSPKNDDTDKWLVRRAREHASLWLGKTLGDLELGGEVIASGQRYNDAANKFELGGYALVNLSAAYKLGEDWALNARVNNLFDREYALATTANSFSPNAPDYGTPDRNLFVGLRWQPK